MVIKPRTIQRIRDIVEKYHRYLLVAMLGKKNSDPELVRRLQAEGFGEPGNDSVLEKVYYHNFLNEQGAQAAPTSLGEMELQQRPQILPKGEAHSSSVEYLNSNLTHLIDRQRSEVLSRIEGMIHANNNSYKYNALQNLDRPEHLDDLVKQSTVGGLKRKLRDASGDAIRNWERIVNTEVSNAVNLGSADRIVNDNKSKPADEVYVYRINPNDAATCKYCRRFYIDSDGSPKVYKLSTILNNGTNFGKKAQDWKPVAAATHPNCRDSQLLELRPGWRVMPGGSQTFIGVDAWKDYIFRKVSE